MLLTLALLLVALLLFFIWKQLERIAHSLVVLAWIARRNHER